MGFQKLEVSGSGASGCLRKVSSAGAPGKAVRQENANTDAARPTGWQSYCALYDPWGSTADMLWTMFRRGSFYLERAMTCTWR